MMEKTTIVIIILIIIAIIWNVSAFMEREREKANPSIHRFSILGAELQNGKEVLKVIMDVPGTYLDGLAKFEGTPGIYKIALAAPHEKKYQIIIHFEPTGKIKK